MMIRVFISLVVMHAFSLAHALPDIQSWKTNQGLKVMYVHAPELPMIDAALTFDAGSDRDSDLPGLSVLAHALLNQGSEKLSADDIASKFEDVGAQFGASVNLDRSTISLRSLSKQAWFDKALELYIQVVTKPSFPERDFEREKNRMLVGLEDKKQRPASIVSEAFYKALYQQHPYADSSSGTEESLKAINVSDIKAFHKKYIVANNSILAIVGDIDRQQVELIANKISSALPMGKKLEAIPAVKPAIPKTEDIYFPSKQAHVRIGMIGIERGNPDYFNLYVGNYILGGGGFTSRLVEEVRSKRGLSYSVYSYFIPYRKPGPFTLGLQTRSDQAKEAIEVSLNVINDFVENGPTQEELALSKQSIANGFPLRVDSNRDTLGYLSMIGYYNLPLSYLDDFRNNIEAVSLEDVRQAFKKHVNVDDLVTIVVGSDPVSPAGE
ncbi:MAG: pitrilysin family protein [Pseudomonadota bacterium]